MIASPAPAEAQHDVARDKANKRSHRPYHDPKSSLLEQQHSSHSVVHKVQRLMPLELQILHGPFWGSIWQQKRVTGSYM